MLCNGGGGRHNGPAAKFTFGVAPIVKAKHYETNPFYYGIFEGGNRGLRRITGLFLPRGGEPLMSHW